MTLCIAAECVYNRRQAVVMASDFSAENESSSGDVSDKLCVAGPYAILIAGQHHRALELLDCILHETNKGEGSILEGLKRGVRAQKRRLADEYISTRLGITYDEFIKIGKTNLPTDAFNEMVSYIRRITLECQLIFVSFRQGGPAMIRTHETGLVEACSNFCAIGAGLTIAESALFHHEHTEYVPLGKAMYHVYEAMKLGSKAPGVGEKFAMSVLSVSRSKLVWECVDFGYFDYLGDRFAEFGPSRVVGVEVQKKFLRPFDAPMELDALKAEEERAREKQRQQVLKAAAKAAGKL